ncbi:hypothetical protein RB195_002583 [Necator americanus]|uniref:Uncharacterized protein n=1 Tax=Necator americanus TaxID=51031 RepID=A0ABR1DKM9_NECAM
MNPYTRKPNPQARVQCQPTVDGHPARHGQRVSLRDRPAHDNGLGSPMHHCRAPGPLRVGAAGIGGGTQGRLPGSGGALRWASRRMAA